MKLTEQAKYITTGCTLTVSAVEEHPSLQCSMILGFTHRLTSLYKSHLIQPLAWLLLSSILSQVVDFEMSEGESSRPSLSASFEQDAQPAAYGASLDLTEVRRTRAPKIVGFLNMFEKDEAVFHKIINEQVDYLEASGVLDRSDQIQYLYFGPNYTSFTVPSASAKYVKSNRSASAGGEVDALDLLHEYCTQNRNDRVFYIHSKGSFNPKPENHLLRRNLMKAVAFCVKESESLEQGHVCGMRTSPVPYPQVSGLPVQKTDVSKNVHLRHK